MDARITINSAVDCETTRKKGKWSNKNNRCVLKGVKLLLIGVIIPVFLNILVAINCGDLKAKTSATFLLHHYAQLIRLTNGIITILIND